MVTSIGHYKTRGGEEASEKGAQQVLAMLKGDGGWQKEF